MQGDAAHFLLTCPIYDVFTSDVLNKISTVYIPITPQLHLFGSQSLLNSDRYLHLYLTRLDNFHFNILAVILFFFYNSNSPPFFLSFSVLHASLVHHIVLSTFEYIFIQTSLTTDCYYPSIYYILGFLYNMLILIYNHITIYN